MIARGPVLLVSPLVATYPLATLALTAIFFRSAQIDQTSSGASSRTLSRDLVQGDNPGVHAFEGSWSRGLDGKIKTPTAVALIVVVGVYLRALAQRVEVDAEELRIMGSKSVLLRTLVAASSAKTAGFGVPSFVPKWRAGQNKTANTYVIEIAI
jgi:hypothetical protein